MIFLSVDPCPASAPTFLRYGLASDILEYACAPAYQSQGGAQLITWASTPASQFTTAAAGSTITAVNSFALYNTLLNQNPAANTYTATIRIIFPHYDVGTLPITLYFSYRTYGQPSISAYEMGYGNANGVYANSAAGSPTATVLTSFDINTAIVTMTHTLYSKSFGQVNYFSMRYCWSGHPDGGHICSTVNLLTDVFSYPLPTVSTSISLGCTANACDSNICAACAPAGYVTLNNIGYDR